MNYRSLPPDAAPLDGPDRHDGHDGHDRHDGDEAALRETLRDWLRAERADRQEAPAVAEQALPRILRALPSPLPSAGFADRVMAATRAAAPLAADLGRRARAVVALALLLTGSTLAVLAPLLVAVVSGVDPGRVAVVLTDALAALIHAMDELVGLGQVVGSVLRALLLGATSVEVLGALTLCALFALLLLRTLRGLLTPSGSPAHVH